MASPPFRRAGSWVEEAEAIQLRDARRESAQDSRRKRQRELEAEAKRDYGTVSGTPAGSGFTESTGVLACGSGSVERVEEEAIGSEVARSPEAKRARSKVGLLTAVEDSLEAAVDQEGEAGDSCMGEDIWEAETPVMSDAEVDRLFFERQAEINADVATVAAKQKRLSAAVSDIVTVRSFLEGDLVEVWPEREDPIQDGRKGCGIVPADYEDEWGPAFVRLPCSPQNTVGAAGLISSQELDASDTGALAESIEPKSTGEVASNKNSAENGENDVTLTQDTLTSSRWEVIRDALCTSASPILSSADLEDAILSYNPEVFDLSGLHYFLNRSMTETETQKFFTSTLPRIIRLAMLLPRLCCRPIPLLLPHAVASATVRFSQMQCASLLANAFLCTFPQQGGMLDRSTDAVRLEKKSLRLPSINFDSLYMGDGRNGELSPAQVGKFRCLLNYFERVTDKFQLPSRSPMVRSGGPIHRIWSTAVDVGHVVSFERRWVSDEALPDWGNSAMLFPPVRVVEKGTIEGDACGELEADFANRMIGGGVLGRGSVQEEIRLIISPETLVARLITPALEGGETLIIRGAEQYSRYRGYSHTFEFGGDFIQNKEKASHTAIVAMDAKNFGNPSLGLPERMRIRQYRRENLHRELAKAYCGFSAEDRDPSSEKIVGGDKLEVSDAGSVVHVRTKVIPVATGNWGAGVFGGYQDRAAVLQLLAAAQAGRPISYFTFGVPGLAVALEEVVCVLREQKVTVGQVYSVLMRISAAVERRLDGVADTSEEGAEASDKARANDSLLPGDPDLPPQLFNVLVETFE